MKDTNRQFRDEVGTAGCVKTKNQTFITPTYGLNINLIIDIWWLLKMKNAFSHKLPSLPLSYRFLHPFTSPVFTEDKEEKVRIEKLIKQHGLEGRLVYPDRRLSKRIAEILKVG